MDKIRILFVTDGEGIGGGQRKTKIFEEHIDKNMFDTQVGLFHMDKTRGLFKEVKHLFVFKRYEDIFDHVRQHNIDVVASQARLPQDIAEKLAKEVKTVQNVNFTELYSPVFATNLIISKTDHLKVKLYNKRRIKNAYVLYNPIEAEKWDRLYKTDIRPYVKPQRRLRVGRIARAEPSKWHYLILSTLHKIKRRGLFSRYVFVFAGMPLLYRKYLEIFFRKEIKRKDIILLPEQVTDEQLAKFYKSIDVFIQTSMYGESFGNVIAESFCFRVPVITDAKLFWDGGDKVHLYRYDAQIELVEENINGLYANYPDVLIRNLERLDKKQCEQMGERGFEKVKRLYDVKKVAQNFQDIIIGAVLKRDEAAAKRIYPSTTELKAFEREYLKNAERIKEQEHSLSGLTTWTFRNKTRLAIAIEFLYTFIRKQLKRIGYDLERHS